MNYRFIHTESSSRLLIIFAGWGMDSEVFSDIRRPGYDIMVVWDYRSFYIDWSCTAPYSEICILAWSMGVYAASQSIQAIDNKITKKIAVCGTLKPIDDQYGIPEAIFNGTMQGLNPQNLKKFYRRMCATSGDFARFNQHLPSRSVDELKEELQAISDSQILHTPSHSRWDLAIIGREDRIFPPHNQKAAWLKREVAIEQIEDCGHYLDFQSIIDHQFIDKLMVGKRFQSGTATYDDHATVQIDVLERIDHKIHEHGIDRDLMDSKNAILEIGSGSGMLTRKVARYINEARYIIWDLAAPVPEGLPLGRKYEFLNCDAESEITRLSPASVDHIVSASTIQWFNSPEKFIKNCYRVLRKGGYAVLSTFTKGNLHQISDITGQGLPLLSAAQWVAISSNYFNVIDVVDYERDLDFETPLDAMRHLKLTGVNSLGRHSGGNVNVRQLLSRIPMMLDGRYHLTYKPLILILQKQ